MGLATFIVSFVILVLIIILGSLAVALFGNFADDVWLPVKPRPLDWTKEESGPSDSVPAPDAAPQQKTSSAPPDVLIAWERIYAEQERAEAETHPAAERRESDRRLCGDTETRSR